MCNHTQAKTSKLHKKYNINRKEATGNSQHVDCLHLPQAQRTQGSVPENQFRRSRPSLNQQEVDGDTGADVDAEGNVHSNNPRSRGTPRSKRLKNQATVDSNLNKTALHHTGTRKAAARHTEAPSNCTRTCVRRRITTTRHRRTTPESSGTSPEMWRIERRGIVCVAFFESEGFRSDL